MATVLEVGRRPERALAHRARKPDTPAHAGSDVATGAAQDAPRCRSVFAVSGSTHAAQQRQWAPLLRTAKRFSPARPRQKERRRWRHTNSVPRDNLGARDLTQPKLGNPGHPPPFMLADVNRWHRPLTEHVNPLQQQGTETLTADTPSKWRSRRPNENRCCQWRPRFHPPSERTLAVGVDRDRPAAPEPGHGLDGGKNLRSLEH